MKAAVSLRAWSFAVATGEVSAEGADALWRWDGVERMFDDLASGVGEELTGTVVLSGDMKVASLRFAEPTCLGG